MRRPGWWPKRWAWPWTEPVPASSKLPKRSSPVGQGEPTVTFLTALLEAFGAERASLLTLDRDREAWVVEREAVGPDGSPSSGGGDPAAGHPLTWCLREELVVQVPAGELNADRTGEGWALAGPIPGAGRVLVIVFHGAPPARARRAMRPALDHLGALEEAGAEAGG